MQMSIVAFATSAGSQFAARDTIRFHARINRLLHLRWETNQYTASTRLAAPKMTPGLSEFTVNHAWQGDGEVAAPELHAAFADPIPTQGCQLPDRAPGEWVMAIFGHLFPSRSRQLGPNKKAVACELMACCHCSTRISMAACRTREFLAGVTDEDIEFPEFTLHMIHHSRIHRSGYIRLNNEPVRAALRTFASVSFAASMFYSSERQSSRRILPTSVLWPCQSPRRSVIKAYLPSATYRWPSFMRKSQ